MKSIKFIYFILIVLVITSCSDRESKYNYLCSFAPSTPTDLKINNDTPENVKINLLVDEDSLKRFGCIELEPNEEKLVCIENEGEIRNGLYLEFSGKHTKAILNPSALNIFNVKNRIFKQIRENIHNE